MYTEVLSYPIQTSVFREDGWPQVGKFCMKLVMTGTDAQASSLIFPSITGVSLRRTASIVRTCKNAGVPTSNNNRTKIFLLSSMADFGDRKYNRQSLCLKGCKSNNKAN